MGEEFNSLASIDLGQTGADGYLWYTDAPFGWPALPADSLSANRSVLTINQTSGEESWGLFTASAKSGKGRGFRFGYFEARLAFDPSHSLTSTKWPSFWALKFDSITGRSSNPRWPELDFFEAYHAPKTAFEKALVGTLHDLTAGNPEKDRSSQPNNYHLLPHVDFQQFHTYGCLWQPGSVTWYFDGTPVITQKYSTHGVPVPNPAGHPVGTFSNMDTDTVPNGMTLILGSGMNYPLQVDWVRVWQ